MDKPRISSQDRIMIEAMKKGITSIGYADGRATYYIKNGDKLLAHDISLAIQSFLLRNL